MAPMYEFEAVQEFSIIPFMMMMMMMMMTYLIITSMGLSLQDWWSYGSYGQERGEDVMMSCVSDRPCDIRSRHPKS